MKKSYKVTGMHCNSCANKIEETLENKGVKTKVSYSNEILEIEFNEDNISEDKIKDIVKELGYDLEEVIITKKPKIPMETKVGIFFIVIAAIILIYIIYHFVVPILNLPEIGTFEPGDNLSLILLFGAGILTGFHCVSMCGGFVLSYTAKNLKNGNKGFKQHIVYGGSKVISYAVIGGIFGLIGGIFAFSVGLRGTIAILAGVFMIFYALSMFGFKFFKKFQFNPKFLTKAVNRTTKKAEGPYKRPFIIGLLNGLFIACGPLQAMYLYAAGTGNALTGALGLGVFGLGTVPIMIGFGSIATVISGKTTKRILMVSGFVVLALGIIMLNNGLTLLGSQYSFTSIKATVVGGATGAAIVDGFQEINMEVNRYGWEPNSFVLQKGVPVKWIIDVKELTGCNNEIIVRNYNLKFKLKKGINTIEFTPDKKGTVSWSCWMGMIPGTFIVTDDGTATDQQITASEPQASGSCGGGADGGSCGSPTCGSSSGGGGGCGCGG
ncbi:hypothetical protein GOV12_05255 [Candidatus Pacearchaeota archaeon]|nr:hypothetical protein [Candidatus Pacearchaeota archaeon]